MLDGLRLQRHVGVAEGFARLWVDDGDEVIRPGQAHPASQFRHAVALLVRENGRYALSTQCIGGGQGIATILERV